MKLAGKHLLLIDIGLAAMAAVGAFVVRYEALWRIWPYIRHNYFFFLAVVLVRPIFYHFFGLYRGWWRYASVADLIRILQAVTAGSIVIGALVYGLLAPKVNGIRTFSGSVVLLEWMLSILAVGGSRMVLRLIHSRGGTTYSRTHRPAPARRALIMGAGDAGALILREMQQNSALGYVPVGFVDDDPAKQGARIYGVPVLGTRRDIPRLAKQKDVAEVVIAMPTAPGGAIRHVRDICKSCQVETKTIPGLCELLNDSVSIGQIREVRIEDLLRRDPVHTDLGVVEGYVQGAMVLVTGAGGSIGSELCRQIARLDPGCLLLLGHGENSIHAIWTELRGRHLGLDLKPLIADVRDADRISRLLDQHRPEIIFHAAAHKHVPLMESNPEEAFSTNVQGTRNLLRAAERAGTERFVLISSDKAVNPVNVMGASKHLAEVVVQHAARVPGHHYCVVRFGNVLGSRGSVVPLFERQIASGGPVTVTHPEMTRFFMTIPEAVQLVLQAAWMGSGGEVFVLDMGDQVRIVDLARDLISLSGLRPDKDVEIVYTGIRPGEKLHEDLFGQDEAPVPTDHQKILRAERKVLLDDDKLTRGIAVLMDAARQQDPGATKAALRGLIPSYCPADELDLPSHSIDEAPTAGRAVVTRPGPV